MNLMKNISALVGGRRRRSRGRRRKYRGGHQVLHPAPVSSTQNGVRRRRGKRHTKRGGLSSQLVPLGLLAGLLAVGSKRRAKRRAKRRTKRRAQVIF